MRLILDHAPRPAPDRAWCLECSAPVAQHGNWWQRFIARHIIDDEPADAPPSRLDALDGVQKLNTEPPGGDKWLVLLSLIALGAVIAWIILAAI